MSPRTVACSLLLGLTACAQQDDASPLADAGPALHGSPGQSFQADGSASWGEHLTWTLLAAPPGSSRRSADLLDAHTPWPTLVPDVDGLYTLGLEVCTAGQGCAWDAVTLRVGSPERLRGALDPQGPAQGLGADPLGFEELELRWGPDDHDPIELRPRLGRKFVDWGVHDNDPVELRPWWGKRPPHGKPQAPGPGAGGLPPGPTQGGELERPPGGGPLPEGGAVHWGLHDTDPVELRPRLGLGLGNAAPVAMASARLGLRPGGAVYLQGGQSYDPDGDSLRYRWSFASLPAGSALGDADLQDPTSAQASFTPDVEGVYLLRLTVRDSEGGVGRARVMAEP